MSRIDNQFQPKFAGYRVDRGENKAKLFLPGHAGLKSEHATKPDGQAPDRFIAAAVKAEVIKPGQKTPQELDLVRQGDYWETSESVPLGSDYRFRVKPDAIKLAENPLTVTLKEKNASVSTPAMTEKNGVWEFENPFPTQLSKTFTVPKASSPLPWRLERLDTGKDGKKLDPVGLPVQLKGENWVFTDDNSSVESRYRLSPALDLREVASHDELGSFNRVSPLEKDAPQKSPVIGDTFQDSTATTDTLRKLDKSKAEGLHVPQLPMRGPNNRFAFDSRNGKAEDGLKELIGILHQAGARGILTKPAIGGDKLSSHGYWTEDAYTLNHSFSSKDAFRDVAGSLTGLDTKLYADGAFVNMGLGSVHQAANRTYGMASPFWRWFKHGDENGKGSPDAYPSAALGKPVYGVLPVKTNAKGYEVLNKEHLGIRILNNPEDSNKPDDSKKPTYIQLYDKRLENPDGTHKAGVDPKILKSSDTVNSYKFEIDPKELKGKTNDPDKIEEMLEWSNFRLGLPSEDNSGAKWDGQIDTALLNTRNPEVVNYLKGAVTYWTRFVMNTNVRNVTHAMLQAQQGLKTDDPAALLEKITQKPGELEALRDAQNPQTLLSKPEVQKLLKSKPLPPIKDADLETLDAKTLQHVYRHIAPDHSEAQNGATFAKRLLKEVPMDVLPLPTLFKADLSYPGLQQALTTANRGKFALFMCDSVLGNLARIPLLGLVFKGMRNFLYPRPFQAELGNKMQDVFNQLDPDLQKRLRYGNVQSLLADKVGEVLYLSLLTNKQPDEVRQLMRDPQALEAAFYQGMPAHILKSDPVTASKFIPELLAKRLKDLSPRQMGNLVEAEVSKLDPGMAAVAQAVLNQRELGLNWRIDAAKDVADMNRIKEAPDHERAQVFEEEFNYVMKFWGKMSHAIREVFPKTTIIPEMTDLELLAGNTSAGKAALKRVQKGLFEGNIFNGMPNMRYIFSSTKQLVNYDGEPSKFGHSQIDPSKFMETMRDFVESLPAPVVRQMQNMDSSHDFATSSHMMLVNPQLFHMDQEKSRGLKEDFTVALDELQHKVCFESERQSLSNLIPNLDDKLKDLQKRLEAPAFKESLTNKQLKAFYDKATKEGADAASKRPTPYEYKGQFVDAVMDATKNLGLTDAKQVTALKAALKARINEPSEAKAMRGVIVNATEDFIAAQSGGIFGYGGLSQADANKLRQAIWPALDRAISKPMPDGKGGYGRHFGYQPLDIALNHVFENINPDALPASLNTRLGAKDQQEALEKLKLQLYQIPTREVMNKLQRLFAVQMAMPGMPSIYVHDLLAQYGGEWTKNIFLQNRNILRTDKIAQATQDPEFKAYFDQVSNLLNARTNANVPQLQALSNGDLLPVTPDDNSGILPVVRDNGKDQVITLVNVGTMPKIESEEDKEKREKAGQPKPLQPLDWLHKAGKGARYDMPQRIMRDENDLRQIYKYQPNLSELGLPNGTRYQDVNATDPSQKYFVVTDGRLHPEGRRNEGVPVDNWRMLVRMNGTGGAMPASSGGWLSGLWS